MKGGGEGKAVKGGGEGRLDGMPELRLSQRRGGLAIIYITAMMLVGYLYYVPTPGNDHHEFSRPFAILHPHLSDLGRPGSSRPALCLSQLKHTIEIAALSEALMLRLCIIEKPIWRTWHLPLTTGRVHSELCSCLLRGVCRQALRVAPRVIINSRVTILDLLQKETIAVQIVEPAKASPQDNAVSVLSPLGKELLGRQVGDFITLRVLTARYRFAIVAINGYPHREDTAFTQVKGG